MTGETEALEARLLTRIAARQGEEVAERMRAALERDRAQAARTRHAHCHWTYRHGRYVSPWYWPTRADAEHASRSMITDIRFTEAPEVYAVHADPCTCPTDDPGPTAYEVTYQKGSTDGTSGDQ